MSFVWEIASKLRQYRKPSRDRSYLAFIRRFPCVGCGSARRVEAAHLGPRGLSQKASDCLALPLCAACHREGPGAIHKIGPERFRERHGIDFAALQEFFNHVYFLKFGEHAKGWIVEDERRKAA